MEVKTSYRAFMLNYILLSLIFLILLILWMNFRLDFTKFSFYSILAIVLIIVALILIDEIFYQRIFKHRIEEKGVAESFVFVIKREKFIPFNNITNVRLERRFFDRILGIGNIEIESSGEKIKIRGIKDPEKFYEEIIKRTNIKT